MTEQQISHTEIQTDQTNKMEQIRSKVTTGTAVARELFPGGRPSKRRGIVSRGGKIFDRALPTDITNHANGLETASEFLQNGMGLIVILNHPSYGDHFRVARTIFESPEIEEANISIAIARHQFSYGIEKAMEWFGVDAHGIITDSTKSKGKNRLHPTEKVSLALQFAKMNILKNKFSHRDKQSVKNLWKSRNNLSQRYGTTKYVDSAVGILNEGGVVFLGPQGTRSETLEAWKGQPVEMLLKRAQNRDNVGFLFIGIDPRGGGKGVNVGHEYGMNIGEALTHDELKTLADERGMSVDEAIFVKLNDAVEQAYLITTERATNAADQSPE